MSNEILTVEDIKNKEFKPLLDVVDKFSEIYARGYSGEITEEEKIELNFMPARFAEALIRCFYVDNSKEVAQYILNNIWKYE